MSRQSLEAARYFQEAERHMAVGEPILAVNCSHQALNAAPRDHEVLLKMLEIHRRCAKMLSGPENFEGALRQLQCALQHRQNDKPTRQALAERYVEQALYLEMQKNLDEARHLLEEALIYADDDHDIIAHLRCLGDV